MFFQGIGESASGMNLLANICKYGTNLFGLCQFDKSGETVIQGQTRIHQGGQLHGESHQVSGRNLGTQLGQRKLERRRNFVFSLCHFDGKKIKLADLLNRSVVIRSVYVTFNKLAALVRGFVGINRHGLYVAS